MKATKNDRPRVAIVTNILPDYRYPVFKSLLDSGRYLLRIFTTVPLQQSCARARANLPLQDAQGINVDVATRHRRAGTTQTEPLSVPIGLVWDLVKFRPDVVVAGDMGIRSILCWIASVLIGARFVIWSEEIATSAEGRSKKQRWLRRWLIKRADAFLAWGTPATEYIIEIGASRRCVFTCAQAIDNEYWTAKADTIDRAEIRNRLGLDGLTFLLVGRLLPLKGFANFLEAWARLPATHAQSCTAVIVGHGEQSRELHDNVRTLGLANVKLVGAKSSDELAEYYAAADVFVIPSLIDVWGLVVNEALCFGLPILGSNRAGAAQYFLSDGLQGRLFDPLNAEAFSAELRSWAERPPPRNKERAREAVAAVSFNASIEAIHLMLGQVLSAKEPNSCVTQPI